MILKVLIPGGTLWIPERIQGSYATICLLEHKNKKIIMEPGYEPSLRFLEEKFQELNLKSDDITDILLSHAHLDHAKNSIYFKNAIVNVHKLYDNKNFNKFGDFSSQSYINMIEDIKKREKKFDNGDILFESIEVVHTPFHSKEHCSFYIKTENMGKVFFPGDICMTRIELYDIMRGLRTDEVANIVKKYYDISDWIVFTHDAPYSIK
ncbi:MULTISPECIES: MBL fold metallo-hydrolase [Oceanotoga]|jgi:glyoxylase-like metal-dependent hydrolase (beta-lactamase superfamily II)|uniref:Glyoxylase-like metal-dependent hydrolase (Beta-lactamase superfamily II) n=1 Tax=Oceanotoga teriensis TaxID=515440 RepID=A0AA45C4M1_9BACT|nr:MULTISPECIES: MBL fold metallo-hydrolase [Oceanotoga]MDN5343540.1 hypothetical protein [Oceanotoga sp.]MDO7977853.1 MBL fold metallo-hydrolase [Oceanotoga teriensis]PWJ86818.1 glyoxylase-like metal-dependent hydrolase (beta-lactamase superfamily II) [Oceanotoga teriensis]